MNKSQKQFYDSNCLFGDRTCDKDRIRKYLMEKNKISLGASSINFDDISRKRIYVQIENRLVFAAFIVNVKYHPLKSQQ